MKLNTPKPTIHTHEGGVAKHINPEQQLRRSVMACMLWESEFYEDGQAIATRIADTIKLVSPEAVAAIAVEAREAMKLRHVPLLLVREMARLKTHRHLVAETLGRVIQRPDELAEFLAIYWKEKRQPLSAQVKKGLAAAFVKFDAHTLAKYNRDGAIKLRDVLFLCHAKAQNDEQSAIFKQLIDGTLPVPDTWEVSISAVTGDTEAAKTEAKKTQWTRLLTENKLGALALLRNLRNMQESNVDMDLVRKSIALMKTERVLPFRFIAAARHAMHLEPELETQMFKCLTGMPRLKGKTTLLIDISGSMDSEISAKSDLKRVDAACALAMLLREICPIIEVFTFSAKAVMVPPRRGFALRDAIVSSQEHGSTNLGAAVQTVLAYKPERLIVISDEQSADTVVDPNCKAYMLNVASAKNGVGYGSWHHIDGWSESCIDYILSLEG